MIFGKLKPTIIGIIHTKVGAEPPPLVYFPLNMLFFNFQILHSSQEDDH